MTQPEHDRPSKRLIPIAWVDKADLRYCQPALEEQIEGLGEADLVKLAILFGEALHQDYWSTLARVLEGYLQQADQEEHDPT